MGEDCAPGVTEAVVGVSGRAGGGGGVGLPSDAAPLNDTVCGSGAGGGGAGGGACNAPALTRLTTDAGNAALCTIVLLMVVWLLMIVVLLMLIC